MSLSNIIALRYLFSKKSHNAINFISAIAVGGIVVATAAMVCTLSVFNGFRDLIGSLYTTFDPQIVVVPTQGKYAPDDDDLLQKVQKHPSVEASSATLEQNALILFRIRCLQLTKRSHIIVRDLSLLIMLGQGEFYRADILKTGARQRHLNRLTGSNLLLRNSRNIIGDGGELRLRGG